MLGDLPWSSGEVLSHKEFVWLCCIWKSVLVPIPWSRIQLYDHTPYQVALGSLLGIALAVLWFVIWQCALYPVQWRVGKVMCRIFKHDFSLPVFKLRAVAAQAVLEGHGGEEAVQKLIQEGKRRELLQEVLDWQRGLERCLNATATAGGTTFKDLLWEIEFEQQDMSQVIQEIKDAYKKELVEGPAPDPDPTEQGAAGDAGAASTPTDKADASADPPAPSSSSPPATAAAEESAANSGEAPPAAAAGGSEGGGVPPADQPAAA